MRLSVVPQTLYERVALACGMIPMPLVDTLIALLLAKTLIAGVACRIVDALERGALPAAEIANRSRMDPNAMERLLRALCACGYLAWRCGGYALTRLSRRWLLRNSPRSLRPAILHRNLDLRLVRIEDYVQRASPPDFHRALDPEDFRHRRRRSDRQRERALPQRRCGTGARSANGDRRRNATLKLRDGDVVIVDGAAGTVVVESQDQRIQDQYPRED